MNIYEWRMPEEPLGIEIVTASHMTIEEIKFEGGRAVSATGTFTFHDHMEGGGGTDRWTATASEFSGKREWCVSKKEEGFSFVSQSGEPLFTLISEVNLAIKAFVAARLNDVIERLRQNPSLKTIVDAPTGYAGLMSTHSGQCVCAKVRASEVSTPFDWKEHTNGGQFPQHCFKCSCGQKWYRGIPEEEYWIQVDDDETWEMLLKNNGVPVEQITVHPEKEPETIVLLRVLRQKGFIPIG